MYYAFSDPSCSHHLFTSLHLPFHPLITYHEHRQALLLAFPKSTPGTDSTNAEGSTNPAENNNNSTTDEGKESAAQRKKNIFCKLREQNQDLLQLVMSFI